MRDDTRAGAGVIIIFLVFASIALWGVILLGTTPNDRIYERCRSSCVDERVYDLEGLRDRVRLIHCLNVCEEILK